MISGRSRHIYASRLPKWEVLSGMCDNSGTVTPNYELILVKKTNPYQFIPLNDMSIRPFRILEKKLKYLFTRLELPLNRLRKRDFIPAKFDEFHIETTSACNLKCKFCPYEKKKSAKVSMSNDMFKDVVEQALKLGYTKFQLTPCTGDVFMDKHSFEKFEFLDKHAQVTGYSFFTNLTIPNHEQLLQLKHLKKLTGMTISVYGHDEESFIAITKGTVNVYHRLLENLQIMLDHCTEWPFGVGVGHRSSLSFGSPGTECSELMQLLVKWQKAGLSLNSSHGMLNNWGGYISNEDVKGLNLRIGSSKEVYKFGACVFVLEWVQVRANGVVDACSCRDVDAMLAIGDIHSKTLREIISSNNTEYMKIINEQEQGNFRPVCASCDFYRSIYHQPTAYRKKDRPPTQSLVQYLEKIKG